MPFQTDITKHEDMQDYSDIKKSERKKRIDAILNDEELNNRQHKELGRFHDFLIKRGLKLESQKAYLTNLRLLLKYFNKDMEDIKDKDINNYLAFLEDKYKPKTITERKKFLLLYFEYYFQKDKKDIPLIKDIVIKRIKNYKIPEELPTPEQIKKMVQVADNLRDKAMIILLYETAARKGEFMQLKIKDIHWPNRDIKKNKFCSITIINAKKKPGEVETRTLPIIYSIPHLINWFNSHPNRDDPNAPLFITLGSYLGRPLGEDGLKERVHILAKRAGIKIKIYPHIFRHARLTALTAELTDQELKQFAGWDKDSNMASTYVHPKEDAIRNKILANAGLIDSKKVNKEKQSLLNIECPSCHRLNPADNKICQCGNILDIQEAQKQINSYKDIQKQLDEIKAFMENQILERAKEKKLKK